MIAILRYTLLTATRDLLFLGLLGAMLLALAISFFLGGSALVEQSQTILVYSVGSIRLILSAGIIVFVCFHVKRGFETREIDVMLSRPLSRTTFVIAYWCGFLLLSLLCIVPIVLVLGVITNAHRMGLVYFGISMVCESAIVSAFALLCALVLKSAVASVFASVGFYVVSRMMAFFMLVVEHLPHALGVDAGNSASWLMEHMLSLIAMVIPRLDLFAKTEWLIYGVSKVQNLWVVPLQAVSYTFLLLVMAIIDVRRKQF